MRPAADSACREWKNASRLEGIAEDQQQLGVTLTLDVIAKNLAVTLSTTLSETLSPKKPPRKSQVQTPETRPDITHLATLSTTGHVQVEFSVVGRIKSISVRELFDESRSIV